MSDIGDFRDPPIRLLDVDKIQSKPKRAVRPDGVANLDLRPGALYRPGLLSSRTVLTGFVPTHPRLDRALNATAALFLIIAVSPLLICISLALWLSGDGPVLYRGIRLGKNKRPFEMLKFRTLQTGSDAKLSHQTLPKRTQMETVIGSYLRQSRLDELPQLFNILRGEMSFFGPRPMRPEMVATYEAEKTNLSNRFDVKPGLIGYSQALLPHSANKRLRGRFNTMCCAAPIRYWPMVKFCFSVGLAVVFRSFKMSVEAIKHLASPTRNHVFLRSGFVKQNRSMIAFGAQDGALISLSDEVLQFVTTLPVAQGPCTVRIERKRRNGRAIQITLQVDVRAVMPLGIGLSGFAGYATIRQISPYDQYRLERYFLGQTVLRA